MICPKCFQQAQFHENSHEYRCGFCGYRRSAPPEEPEIERRGVIVSVDIPQDEKPLENLKKGKKRGPGMGSMFSYGSRSEYLSRHNLLEADIQLDDSGKEYWLKDNFYTGTTEKVFVPSRYKNARQHIL